MLSGIPHGLHRDASNGLFPFLYLLFLQSSDPHFFIFSFQFFYLIYGCSYLTRVPYCLIFPSLNLQKERFLDVDGTRVKLQLWDTAGQERFRTITSSYYRGSQGVIVMFDLTKEDTFKNVIKWLAELERYAAEDVRRILVGNKSDLPNRQVQAKDALELADRLGLEYIETSAKDTTNVDQVFMTLAKNIKDRTMEE